MVPTRKIAVFFATGFGLGRSRFMPGTFGTLPGIVLAGAIQAAGRATGHEIPFHIAAATLLCLISIPICTAGEQAAGHKDPHCVVADEYLTFPIVMIGLPFSPLMVAVAFVTHRAFDILKPFPAYRLQRLPGGWGITVDDVVSSLYSLALNQAVFRMLSHYGVLGAP